MEKARKASIRTKLILSYCLLIVIFILYGLLSIFDQRTLFSLTQTLYNHPLVVSNAALQANVSITKMHRDMKDVVLFQVPERINQSIEAVAEQEKRVYQHLDIIRHNILGTEGKQLENETRILFDQWRPIRSRVIELVNQNQRIEAANITREEGADHVAKLEQKMVELTGYARGKASLFMDESRETYSGLSIKSWIFLLLGLTTSTLIAFFTIRQIMLSEKALRTSEEVYRSLVESQIDLIARITPDGKFTYVNEVFCSFFDKTRESLVGSSWQPIPVDDDVALIEEKLSTLSVDNPTVVIENRVRSGKGDIHWIQFINSGFFDENGNVVEIQSVGRDITERVKSEKERELHRTGH